MEKGYTERAVATYIFVIEVLIFHLTRSKWYTLEKAFEQAA